MRARFKNTLRLITFLLICALALGAGYFFYKKYLDNGPEIKAIGDLSINYDSGKRVRVLEEKIIKFSIINNSDQDAYYYIEFKNIKGLKKAKYTLTDENEINISKKLLKQNSIVADNVLIKGNSSVFYTLRVTNETSTSFTFELNIDSEIISENYASDIILKNNSIKKEPVTELGKEVATENEGLIQTTDESGTVYYFRGAVDNNYLSIGDLMFRVMRINSDQSIQLVLDNVTPDLKSYNGDSDYKMEGSNLLNYLNEWFLNNLSEYKAFVTSKKYCDDTIIDDNNKFPAFDRVTKNNIISFICLGNTYNSKVGMLSIDDVIYAGGTVNSVNKSYYLYNSSITGEYYLATGATYSYGTFYPFAVNKDGKIISNIPGNYLRSIRPVITLDRSVTIEGNGTVNDPYVLTK